jgi:type IV fimbrial biogenesis protein FimT
MTSPQHGLTLLELLIVIGLTVLLLAMAVPTYSRLATQARFAELSEVLIASLDYARNEAIRTSQPVNVCALNAKSNLNIQGCQSKQLSKEFTWDEGALLYIDSPDGSSHAYDSQEAIRHALFRGDIEVRSNYRQFTFSNEGRVDERIAPTFTLRDRASQICRTIRVSLSGKANACFPQERGCDIC